MSTPSGKEISVWNVWENSKRDATGAPARGVEGAGASEPDSARLSAPGALRSAARASRGT